MHAALDDGTLAADRWESYLKLQAELAHLERKLDKRPRRRSGSVAKAGAEGRANMRAKGRR